MAQPSALQADPEMDSQKTQFNGFEYEGVLGLVDQIRETRDLEVVALLEYLIRIGPSIISAKYEDYGHKFFQAIMAVWVVEIYGALEKDVVTVSFLKRRC